MFFCLGEVQACKLRLFHPPSICKFPSTLLHLLRVGKNFLQRSLKSSVKNMRVQYFRNPSHVSLHLLLILHHLYTYHYRFSIINEKLTLSPTFPLLIPFLHTISFFRSSYSPVITIKLSFNSFPLILLDLLP